MEEDSKEFRQKTIEFLKALNEETQERGAIRFGYDLLQLGGHFNFTEQQTLNLIGAFLSNGYIRYLNNGKQFEVTQLGRQIIKDDEDESLQEKPQEGDTPYKYSIFISRINEHKEISKKLKELLESLFDDKISVFDADDPNCIPFSEDWFTSIKKGIQDCKLMLILCSPLSVQRPWINFEAGAATILETNIGPICFAGQSAGNLPSPLNYIRSQAVDISDHEKFQQYFNSLLDRIASQVNMETPIVNVLETDFFKLLINARDSGKPKKPRIFAVRGF